MLNNFEIKEAKGTLTAGGDTTIVAAVAGKRIRVVAGDVSCTGTAATNVTLKSGATAISHTFQNGASGGGRVWPFSEDGWFTTAAGSALVATVGAGSDQTIYLQYVEI